MHHLIPQAPCLVTATGEWAADYVVRTENLAEDMREVWFMPALRIMWIWSVADLLLAGCFGPLETPACTGISAHTTTTEQAAMWQLQGLPAKSAAVHAPCTAWPGPPLLYAFSHPMMHRCSMQ